MSNVSQESLSTKRLQRAESLLASYSLRTAPFIGEELIYVSTPGDYEGGVTFRAHRRFPCPLS
jgi:hypothetical protein